MRRCTAAMLQVLLSEELKTEGVAVLLLHPGFSSPARSRALSWQWQHRPPGVLRLEAPLAHGGPLLGPRRTAVKPCRGAVFNL